MSKFATVWILLIAAPCAFPQQPSSTTQTTTTTTSTTVVRRDTVHRVDPGQMYHRVYARMPLTGTGKKGDPIRPMVVPAAFAASPGTHSGVLGYTMLISDDGKWALCEFVGATPADLQLVTSAAGPNVVIFSRGTNTVAQIEADFQQYLKSFTFASFEPFTTRVE